MMQYKLYALRKDRGIKQTEMAKLIDVSVVTYRNKEKSRVPFDSDEMFIIAKFFNKELGEVFLPTKSPNR